MGYYLIDIENVGDVGFQGYEKLTKKDVIVVFYRYETQLSKKIKKVMEDTEAIVELKVFDGTTKNAMDFNIVAYLGYLIGQGVAKNYTIVSRDNGYKTALTLLRTLDENVTLSLLPNISNTYLSISRKNRRLLLEDKLNDIRGDFNTEEQFQKVVNICAKSSNLSDLNNKVTHSFKKDECPRIYSMIKPIYEEVVKEII